METNTFIIMAVVVAVVIIAIYLFFYLREKKAYKNIIEEEVKTPSTNASNPLQLQAYERLVILAERIALPNLISRLNQPGASKQEMQLLLTSAIKQEFEYNLSQQIYVSAQAWDAIRTLKDQNIHLVNQVALILPNEADGQELNKKILEVIMSQPQGSMHSMVQEALSHEAKKLL